ncbi:hypothetical protein [Capnocytophaga canimorsus]|uniref:hypothetical protein n=1 Tax=Capnocytophaga canimorsus TaxID=28188 RepID=UPI0015627229|nr:hypothetical protein [Capnocytophaga canimorsus]
MKNTIFVGASAPHRTAPHRTAPHRTAPHRTAPKIGYTSFILYGAKSVWKKTFLPNGFFMYALKGSL